MTGTGIQDAFKAFQEQVFGLTVYITILCV
jgi:hypothetical protein